MMKNYVINLWVAGICFLIIGAAIIFNVKPFVEYMKTALLVLAIITTGIRLAVIILGIHPPAKQTFWYRMFFSVPDKSKLAIMYALVITVCFYVLKYRVI